MEDVAVRAVILVNEREGGAGNIIGFGGAKALRNALDQGGFAGAEIAAQQDHVRVA